MMIKNISRHGIIQYEISRKPVASEEMEQAHGRPNKQIIQLILGDMSESESEKLSSEKEAMYREVCRSEGKDYHLVFGLEELLEEAKQQGILMTIASASIKPNIDFFVEHFQLDRFLIRQKSFMMTVHMPIKRPCIKRQRRQSV